jgi:hypothetical protein
LRLSHKKESRGAFNASNAKLEIQMKEVTNYSHLMLDTSDNQFIKAASAPLTPLGLLKLRSDLIQAGHITRKAPTGFFKAKNSKTIVKN